MRDWRHSSVHRLEQPGAYIVTTGTYLYWETKLTYSESDFARLSCVHRNAVHHRIVREASLCPLCSAGLDQRRATTSFYKRIMQMKIDRVHVNPR
jgi:hypothetical protein